MLSELDPSAIIVEGDVNALWKNWNKEFMKVMELCIPHEMLPRRKNLPWLSKSIIQLKHNCLFKSQKCHLHTYRSTNMSGIK